MPKILVIHGAGMNMRGKVQLDVFGPTTLPEYDERIRGYAKELGVEVEIFHSNVEGEIVNKLYAANDAGVDAARVKEALDRAAIFRKRFAVEVPENDIDDAPARILAADIAERAVTHHGPPLPPLNGRVRVATFGSARQSFVEETADPVVEYT